MTELQQALEEKVSNNGTARLDTLKTMTDDKISEGKKKIADAKSATLGRREEISQTARAEIERTKRRPQTDKRSPMLNEATIASGTRN